jgi:hypothetical protein
MNLATLRDFFVVAPIIYEGVGRLAVQNFKPSQLAELKKWLALARIAERMTPYLAIAATVPAGDVKGIWRQAVDAGLVADDENGYASVRGDLAALRRDGVAITPSRAVGRDGSRSKSAAWIRR